MPKRGLGRRTSKMCLCRSATPACLSVCLSVFSSVCLPACLAIHLFVCLSSPFICLFFSVSPSVYVHQILFYFIGLFRKFGVYGWRPFLFQILDPLSLVVYCSALHLLEYIDCVNPPVTCRRSTFESRPVYYLVHYQIK